MKRRIHIIGGGSGIGKWLAEKIFIDLGEVFCYDISSKHLEKLEKTIQKCYLSPQKSFTNHSKKFKPGDWIMFAVPQPELSKTIELILPVIKPGSLLVVLTSTQTEAIKVLKSKIPATCAYLGFHPLFGPTIESSIGQQAALTCFDQTQNRHIDFLNVLTQKKLTISKLTTEQHDEKMALIQALTHFCLMGFASTINSSKTNPSDLLKIGTPNFKILFAFASRILKLSTTTTGSIQYTPEANLIRKSFLLSLNKLHEDLSKSTSVGKAADVITSIGSTWTNTILVEGAETAAVAVDSLQRFEELLHTYKEQEKPFVFYHRTSGKIHIVRILNISHDEIEYEESTIIRNGWTAIGLFEKAKINYRKIGINFRKPHKLTIKKHNIKLLNNKELYTFYREKILPIKKFLNFKNPYYVTEDYIEEILPLSINGLWKSEFIEVYRRRNEIEKISLVAYFNPNIDIAHSMNEIKLAIEEKKLTSSSRKSEE